MGGAAVALLQAANNSVARPLMESMGGYKPGLVDELTEKLLPLIEPPGFTGRAPGGPSRWSTRRTEEWQPLRNDLSSLIPPPPPLARTIWNSGSLKIV